MSLCSAALACDCLVVNGLFLGFVSYPAVDPVVGVSWLLFGVSVGQLLHPLQLLQT